MTLEQEKEAIQKKLDKVTKELEKVKRAAAQETYLIRTLVRNLGSAPARFDYACR